MKARKIMHSSGNIDIILVLTQDEASNLAEICAHNTPSQIPALISDVATTRTNVYNFITQLYQTLVHVRVARSENTFVRQTSHLSGQTAENGSANRSW